MHSKQQSIIATVSFILLLPLVVTCLPTSLQERDEVNSNFAEESKKIFLNLQVSDETDSTDYDEVEDPGCNQIPGEDTCTLVKPKMCYEVICFSGEPEYICAAWTPNCSTNICPPTKYPEQAKDG